MHFQYSYKIILSALFAVTLTACGSGGGGDSGSGSTDTTPPAAPAGTSTSSASNGLLTVSGNAEANSTVEVTFPNGSKKTVTVSSAGTYSVTSALPQPNGSISVVSRDSGGNASQPTTVAFVDSTVPDAPTGTIINALDSGLVTVSGSAEANSTVKVTFPDGSEKTAVAASDGSYSLTSDQVQPSGNISIVSADSAGNNSAPTQQAFTADLDSVIVLKALYKATGTMPELAFKPSLGINTEAPQGGADTAQTTATDGSGQMIVLEMPDYLEVFRSEDSV